MSRAWYIYNGPDGASDEATVGKYSFVGFLPNCNDGTHLCAVYAVYGGDQPLSLSQRLRNYYPIAKTNQSHYPSAPGAKPYAYTKT